MKLEPSTLEALAARFSGSSASEFRGRTRLVAPKAQLEPLFEALKNEYGFDLLVDVTCVDYLYYRDAAHRFGLAYVLRNTRDNRLLVVRVFLDEDDLEVPTACRWWKGADWLEREVYDMFGIRFAGHPDLRRILLPEAFTAFPLRKDYPLQGLGERHNFPVLTRGES